MDRRLSPLGLATYQRHREAGSPARFAFHAARLADAYAFTRDGWKYDATADAFIASFNGYDVKVTRETDYTHGAELYGRATHEKAPDTIGNPAWTVGGPLSRRFFLPARSWRLEARFLNRKKGMSRHAAYLHAMNEARDNAWRASSLYAETVTVRVSRNGITLATDYAHGSTGQATALDFALNEGMIRICLDDAGHAAEELRQAA